MYHNLQKGLIKIRFNHLWLQINIKFLPEKIQFKTKQACPNCLQIYNTMPVKTAEQTGMFIKYSYIKCYKKYLRNQRTNRPF